MSLSSRRFCSHSDRVAQMRFVASLDPIWVMSSQTFWLGSAGGPALLEGTWAGSAIDTVGTESNNSAQQSRGAIVVSSSAFRCGY